MRSMTHRRAVSLALLPMLWLASACGSSGGYPPLADIKAVTEAKPVPGDEIASDPDAEAHYNASVEGWGDRIWSAGARLCRFYQRTKMPNVDFCPVPLTP